MDWAKEFYSLQNRWLQVYLGEVDASHEQRARVVAAMGGHRPSLRVLELGAGGGQTAIALAQLGYSVTTIELLEDSVAHARQLTAEHALTSDITILQGDFYTIELEGQFDAVCYFDSFGIGSDADQQRLLQRVAHWLKPDGYAVIEVGMPWYWAVTARGQRMEFGDFCRVYDFDPVECRLLDYWYPLAHPEQRVYQRLRCYAPADFRLLLAPTGLELAELQPNGAVDYKQMRFMEDVPLVECMTYYAKVEPRFIAATAT